jgi:hypothetical protein
MMAVGSWPFSFGWRVSVSCSGLISPDAPLGGPDKPGNDDRGTARWNNVVVRCVLGDAAVRAA